MANKPDDPAVLAAQTEYLRQLAHARNARRYADTAAGKPIRRAGASVSDEVGFEVDDEEPEPEPAKRTR